MTVFAKIFAQIFDSSISADYVVRHVFMDLLVLADRDGVVDMTLDAISRRTNVPEAIVSHAIQELMREDRKSRSHEEDGRRLVAIDSHRDWGWQIVNYEHYREIKDEEARRTYFRDKKRAQRALRVTESPSSVTQPLRPTVSNSVKDIPIESNKVTQGEAEADTDTEVKGRTAAPDSGSELALAAWLFEEAGIVGDNSTRRIAAEAIRLLAKEGGTMQTAAQFILTIAKRAIAEGETINRFWFTDQRYRPQKPQKTRREREREAATKAFMEAGEDE